MSGYLNCIECERKFKKLYPDPRNPPLEIGDCLCNECTDTAYDEVIEEASDYLALLKINQQAHQLK